MSDAGTVRAVGVIIIRLIVTVYIQLQTLCSVFACEYLVNVTYEPYTIL